jgi:AcrR family transcriptional regulator
MPRRYSMERRTAAVDETRQRIVEATMSLHDEKGILATSMQDIAARAGVALGTVYRHFPSIDELIPACGGRTFEIHPPPTPAVFEGLQDGAERVGALFAALYAHYEAAERPYAVGMAEADHIPVLKAFMDEGMGHIRALVSEALKPMAPSQQGPGVAIALADFRTWQAFHDAGFDSETAAQIAAQIVVTQLSPEASGA